VKLGARRPDAVRHLRRPFKNGRIELHDIDTETYLDVRVEIDLDPENPPNMPGDHIAEPRGLWSLDRDGETLRRRVDTEQIIRLLRPEDNRFGLPRRVGGVVPAFRSPLTFEWEPVPNATSYRAAVLRSRRVSVASATITKTSWTVELPDGQYLFRLEAFHAGERVGWLEGVAIDYTTPEYYAFRVAAIEDPPAHDPAPHRAVREGTATLAIVPTLDGRPLPLSPRSWVRVGLMGEPAVRTADERPIEGLAQISRLPAGTYTPRLLLYGQRDAQRRRSLCESHPTDPPTELRLTDASTTRVEIPVNCDVQLLQPEPADDAESAPRELSSPTTFSWHPVPRAVRYSYEVQRPDWRSPLTAVAQGETGKPTCTVALEPSLPGEHYRLTLSAHGEREILGRLERFDFRVAGGVPAPGTATMVLVPTFDGQRLEETLDVPLTVTLHPVPNGDARELSARLAKGVVELAGVDTGVYNVNFVLPVKDAPELFTAGRNRPVALLESGKAVRQEMAMYAPLEFITGPPMRTAPRIDRPMLRSPVTIEWKPVHGAVRYRVQLDPAGTTDGDYEVETFEVTSPSWHGELRPTRPDGYYTMIVEALGRHARVGEWIFHFGVVDGERRSR
jgi:hypothetical protein